MRNKSLFVAIGLSALVLACGSKPETQSTSEDYGTPEQESTSSMSGPDIIAQGEALVKTSDCKTCHHATNKIIGPSHTDVAKKYDFTAANVAYLAGKIKAGGAGVWGETPMNAHPDLSDADAEKMARYVLSLDGEKEH